MKVYIAFAADWDMYETLGVFEKKEDAIAECEKQIKLKLDKEYKDILLILCNVFGVEEWELNNPTEHKLVWKRNLENET